MILGDKGDGSPRARAVALQRYAWANEGHVPDIIHKNAADNGMHELFESKVYRYTAAKTSNNKGGGTPAPALPACQGRRLALDCRGPLRLVRLHGGEAHRGERRLPRARVRK